MPDSFSDLPDALVRDLLAIATPVAENVRLRMETLKGSRQAFRSSAQDKGLIKRKADLEVTREPSVAGIDGSYQIHRLTSLDLCAAASVAIEGTSKEAKRFWPEPRHRMWAGDVPHNDSTTGVLRSLMVGMELDLANEAPHDLVLLDGSFSSLVIYLNQGLSNVGAVPKGLADEFLKRWKEQNIFDSTLNLMQSDRVVAVPKFTSRNELVDFGGLPAVDGIDGRTLSTLILEPGEYFSPLHIHGGTEKKEPGKKEKEEFHLPSNFCPKSAQEKMNKIMQEIQVVYFKPYSWSPALRLELPSPIANSPSKLAIALEGIARQFFSPAVIEPYPLFLADRMVKSLGAGVSVIEQTVTQHVADQGGDMELTMLCLQNFRTEGGRGGI